MSIKDYLLAVDLINNSGEGDFEGSKPESLIKKLSRF